MEANWYEPLLEAYTRWISEIQELGIHSDTHLEVLSKKHDEFRKLAIRLGAHNGEFEAQDERFWAIEEAYKQEEILADLNHDFLADQFAGRA